MTKRDLDDDAVLDESRLSHVQRTPKRAHVITEARPNECDMVVLENWSIMCRRSFNPYEDPAVFGVRCLSGHVSGHPTLEDGQQVLSSAVLYISGSVARTVSRWYKLGTVDPHFVDYAEEHGFDHSFSNGVELNLHLHIVGVD